MRNKIRKIMVWLLLTLLVAGTAAGCGTKPSVPAKFQEQQSEQQSEAESLKERQSETDQENEEEDDSDQDEENAAESQTEEESAEESSEEESAEESSAELASEEELAEEPAEDGIYTDKDQVALYLHIYGHLPDNYITKKEAQNLGWDNKKGNLDEVAPGKSIGGSYFGNYEGLLPEKSGRKYYECDLDYEGGYRGAKRLIYSNDGLIFYTEDHYKTFEQLY